MSEHEGQFKLGQVEGVKNTTGPVRKKNFDKKITARN